MTEMFFERGYWWPTGIKPSSVRHAFWHVKAADVPISLCRRRRRVVQAGGNVGLWPRRMSQSFAHVETFEPEPAVQQCLLRNAGEVANITVHRCALGAEPGRCSMTRDSLAAHHVTEGDDVEIRTLDSFGFTDVDLIQLDVEGFELSALKGAQVTLERSRPVIQVEMLNSSGRYDSSDEDLTRFLTELRYRVALRMFGGDVIFMPDEVPLRVTWPYLWMRAGMMVQPLLRGAFLRRVLRR